VIGCKVAIKVAFQARNMQSFPLAKNRRRVSLIIGGRAGRLYHRGRITARGGRSERSDEPTSVGILDI